MKKIIFLLLFCLGLFASYKVYEYYADNGLYANYVVEQYWQGKGSVIDDGYTESVSYDFGDTIKVYVNASETTTTYVRLFDINGSVVDSVKSYITSQQSQDNGSELGFGYTTSFEYVVPERKGGIYLWENKIPFLVKGKRSKVGVLYSSNTTNAYNITGGKSFYSIFSEQSHQVSFQRPVFPAVSFQLRAGLEYFFNYPDEHFCYLSDMDLDDDHALEGLKLLVIIGHSEYWTRKARENFDKFVDEGGNALILSGNTMWWQVRYDKSRTRLICYKNETDPENDPKLKTIEWSQEMLDYPVHESIGLSFEYGGFGRKHGVGYDGLKIWAPSHPAFAGTGLSAGDVLSIPTKEYDGVCISESGMMVPRNPNIQLLAYDSLSVTTNGAFIQYQKSDSSGIIINTGTMDWCSDYGLGGEDSVVLRKITDNMMRVLLEKSN